MCYRTLEIIIMRRMEKEEIKSKTEKINKNQIGFQEGKGCEINILKVQ